MQNDTTVIYYTSNRENPDFEARIIRSLRHACRPLPIISVSQKPIDLGTNICVGEVGISARNAWRQFQIGCKAAKTRFVCPAESDMLFPKDYFRFIPPRDDTFYTARPVYVLFAQRRATKSFALKPRGTEAALVANREYVLDRLEKMLGSGMGTQWRDMEAANEMDDFPYIFQAGNGVRRENFMVSLPVITFKTDQNMHRKTPARLRRKPEVHSRNRHSIRIDKEVHAWNEIATDGRKPEAFTTTTYFATGIFAAGGE